MRGNPKKLKIMKAEYGGGHTLNLWFSDGKVQTVIRLIGEKKLFSKGWGNLVRLDIGVYRIFLVSNWE